MTRAPDRDRDIDLEVAIRSLHLAHMIRVIGRRSLHGRAFVFSVDPMREHRRRQEIVRFGCWILPN
jgi:hypothetical protein